MTKQLVFVDDSGDPGFKELSSTNFIMAAAVFIDPDVAMLLSKRISDYRKSLGWRDDHEFKFAKIRKDIIVELLKIASGYDFKIYATCVDKISFRNTAPIIDKEKLYNWTIKELLTMIPMSDAKIKIDGRSGKQYMRKTAAYLRHEINRDNTKKLKIKFENSDNNDLLQLADSIASSINRSMTSKTDANVYVNIIKSKIIEIKRLN